ncbi:FAD-dependent thymidylate synthase, partial [Pelagibacteraceae bacterium]|nr:FAD-dependent thymidylate synthase [Pelagibacteraceae bacterium]
MNNIKLYFEDSIFLLKMTLTKQQKNEISEQQSQKNSTKRVTSPELEKILYEALPVLDHGFVRVVDYMGDDSSIVQAARVSYGKGTKKISTDSGLIKYLMRHRHSTPFEMCEIKYHVKLPIFVARQWIRHRTANVNEYSARYSILDKEFYLPSKGNLAAQSQSNRQGRGEVINGKQADNILDILKKDAEQTYANYEFMLNEKFDGSKINEKNKGLARELARMNLTLNTYTQWYWKTDLLNLLNFLSLRADNHAQYEIRAYAEAMINTLKRWVPITFDAFMDYRIGGMELSAKGKLVIQKMLKGEGCDLETSKLSKREWNELMESFGFKEKI